VATGPDEHADAATTDPRTVARQRLRGIASGRPDTGAWIAAALLAAFGFGAAVTVTVEAEEALDRAGRDDLVRILDGLTGRADQLEQSLADLERTRAELASGADADAAAIEAAEQRLADLGILAGTVPATGPGIRLRALADPGTLEAGVLLRAVHELRDAGAEAIQLEGRDPTGSRTATVRIVASTPFVDADAGVLVGGVALDAPFTLLAIGDPDTLATAVQIPGGVVSEVETAGGSAVVEPLEEVLVDALQPQTTPQYARPAPPSPS
jgi:uncharacterized protein YlxW (UPF0749 family)